MGTSRPGAAAVRLHPPGLVTGGSGGTLRAGVRTCGCLAGRAATHHLGGAARQRARWRVPAVGGTAAWCAKWRRTMTRNRTGCCFDDQCLRRGETCRCAGDPTGQHDTHPRVADRWMAELIALPPDASKPRPAAASPRPAPLDPPSNWMIACGKPSVGAIRARVLALRLLWHDRPPLANDRLGAPVRLLLHEVSEHAVSAKGSSATWRKAASPDVALEDGAPGTRSMFPSDDAGAGRGRGAGQRC